MSDPASGPWPAGPEPARPARASQRSHPRHRGDTGTRWPVGQPALCRRALARRSRPRWRSGKPAPEPYRRRDPTAWGPRRWRGRRTSSDDLTMTDGDQRPQQDAGSLGAAEAGLARIKDQLEAASRGDATAADVKASLQGYMDAHGPAIKAAAASVGDEVRRQAL